MTTRNRVRVSLIQAVVIALAIVVALLVATWTGPETERFYHPPKLEPWPEAAP